MKGARYIGFNQLDDSLKVMFSESSLIMPLERVEDLPTSLVSEYYRIMTGVERNNLYAWSPTDEQYMLIGANDTSVPWSDVKEKPANFPPVPHTHSISDVNGLVEALTGDGGEVVVDMSWDAIQDKPVAFPPTTHTHTWAQVTGKPTQFTPTSHTHTWSDVTNKPSEYTPAYHTHTASEISGLDDYKITTGTIQPDRGMWYNVIN